jgi:hypothetical protein
MDNQECEIFARYRVLLVGSAADLTLEISKDLLYSDEANSSVRAKVEVLGGE